MKTPKTSAFVGLMVLVLAFASACSSGGGTSTTTPPTSAATTPASSGSGSVTVTMTDFKFTPSNVTASTSQDIVLVNNGSALHNFTIATTGVSIDVAPGETQTLTAPGPSFKAGTYSIFCKYHQASGMTGTLIATGG